MWQHTTVYYNDYEIIQRLGWDLLLTCKVTKWRKINGKLCPSSWLVPSKIIDKMGDIPLTETESNNLRQEVTNKVKQGGKLKRSLATNQICPLKAELLQYWSFYRHVFTNYDELLDYGVEKTEARRTAEEQPRPSNWKDYKDKYGLSSPTIDKITDLIRFNPVDVRPTWLKEMEIAVKYTQTDPTTMTFQDLFAARDTFRMSTGR